jgi:hypothetical protein
MAIARTIIALLVAVSVALLPAVAGAAFALKPATAAAMAGADNMHQGCPHSKPGKSMGDLASMADCALKCFSFSPSAGSPIAFPPVLAGLVLAPVSLAVPAQAISPPFRPPRA